MQVPKSDWEREGCPHQSESLPSVPRVSLQPSGACFFSSRVTRPPGGKQRTREKCRRTKPGELNPSKRVEGVRQSAILWGVSGGREGALMRVVYGIWALHSRKVVIGSSVNHIQRWGVHRRALRRGDHWNSHLQRVYTKYGARNLKYTIMELIPDDADTFAREQWWLNKMWKTGRLMNEAREVLRWPFFHELPKEKQERIRQRVSKARKKYWKNLSPKKRASLAKSLYKGGRRNYWLGKKRPAGKQGMRGKTHTRATLQKMRLARKKWWAKNSGWSRRQSPESIAKIRAARKAWWAERKKQTG